MEKARADGASAPLPLPETDRQAIEHGLGRGVVGAAVAAPRIDDPARFMGLSLSPRSYRVIVRPEGGRNENHGYVPVKDARGHVTWHLGVGSPEVGLLDTAEDGSFVLSGVQDLEEGVETRYSPPEPVLLKGVEAGQARKVDMSVQVYDLDRPATVRHEGSLAVTYRYLGAFRVTVPAGTFDSILIKSTFDGQIGPARLADTQYRFFAERVGLVATVEQRDVSALVVYRARTDLAKLLVVKPP